MPLRLDVNINDVLAVALARLVNLVSRSLKNHGKMHDDKVERKIYEAGLWAAGFWYLESLLLMVF